MTAASCSINLKMFSRLSFGNRFLSVFALAVVLSLVFRFQSRPELTIGGVGSGFEFQEVMALTGQPSEWELSPTTAFYDESLLESVAFCEHGEVCSISGKQLEVNGNVLLMTGFRKEDCLRRLSSLGSLQSVPHKTGSGCYSYGDLLIGLDFSNGGLTKVHIANRVGCGRIRRFLSRLTAMLGLP